MLNNDIYNKKKTAWRKLVGMEWCDIHKERYVKVCYIPVGTEYWQSKAT